MDDVILTVKTELFGTSSTINSHVFGYESKGRKSVHITCKCSGTLYILVALSPKNNFS